jgi:hypothetical protein
MDISGKQLDRLSSCTGGRKGRIMTLSWEEDERASI